MNQISSASTLPKHVTPVRVAPTYRRHFGAINSGRNRSLYDLATSLAISPYRKPPVAINGFGGRPSLIPWLKDWLGSRESSPDLVSEETRRLAREMHGAFGIKGFVLNMVGSTSLAAALPACWDSLRPCLDSPELEDAAARIQAEAFLLAEDLGATPDHSSLRLSRDEASHLQAGLDFYHFILPKMLVLTSALRLACDQERIKRTTIGRSTPEETVAEEDGLHGLFQDIRRIVPLSGFQVSATMPRAWSKYLAAASARLLPIVHGGNYNRAANRLRTISFQGALAFQDRINSVALAKLEDISEQMTRLETQLPSLIISITLLKLFFRPADKTNPAPLALAQPVPGADLEISPERRGTYQRPMGVPTAMLSSIYRIEIPTLLTP